MFKKLTVILLSSTIISLMSITPTFASQTLREQYALSPSDQIVDQGIGYIGTINSKLTKQSVEKSLGLNAGIKPMAVSKYSISQGGSGTFNGTTSNKYSNGYLNISSAVTMADSHYITRDDSLNASGTESPSWTGTTPSSNCDQLVIQPNQTASATQAVYSISASGPSQSFTGTTRTFAWPSITKTNSWQYSYHWNQWSAGTGGHFTSLLEDDAATFDFGSDGYAYDNNILVSIN